MREKNAHTIHFEEWQWIYHTFDLPEKPGSSEHIPFFCILPKISKIAHDKKITGRATKKDEEKRTVSIHSLIFTHQKKRSDDRRGGKIETER